MERPTMPATLVHELCGALGVALPGDRAGVEELHRAWAARVPFDPVAKAEAMARGERPPGDDPVAVVERWLATGIGSTCWGHCTVLVAVLAQAGVRATIGLDRMLTDELVDFHSFVLVDLDGDRYVLDRVHVSGDLLAFAPGARGNHPCYRVGIDDDDGRLVHWFASAASGHAEGRYAVLATDLDQSDVRAFLTISAEHSGVRRRFFSRRAHPDHIVGFRPTAGGDAIEATTYTADGETVTVLTDLDDAIDRIGLHGSAVDHLVAGGLLDPTSPTPWTV